MKKIIFVFCIISLAACSNLKFEWKASYKTDNLIEDLEKNK